MTVLVDSNILIDVFTADLRWSRWSAQAIADAADQNQLAINPIIYAELAAGFATAGELDSIIDGQFLRLELPYEAGFVAGRAFREYRRRGGPRATLLPDLYIGAHAAVTGMKLLTRDASRYRSYFPALRLICP